MGCVCIKNYIKQSAQQNKTVNTCEVGTFSSCCGQGVTTTLKMEDLLDPLFSHISTVSVFSVLCALAPDLMTSYSHGWLGGCANVQMLCSGTL